MAYAIVNRTLQDSQGNVLNGATVTVRNHGDGTLADIYSSRASTTPIANSEVTADADGTIEFYAPTGTYRLVAVGDGGSETQVVDVWAVQDTLTDITPDQLMKVGAFGLGLTGAILYPLSDVDADPASVPNGMYRIDSSLANRPFGLSGVVLVMHYNSGEVAMTYYSRGQASFGASRYYSNGWSDWLVGPTFDTVQQLLDSDATTLGPVGQIVWAGGLPYEVVASGGDIENAGGQQFKILPGQNGYNGKSFGAAPVTVRGVDTGAEIEASYFGMTGNTTKNNQALQDAATVFAANKGGKLLIPEGYYSFDVEIEFPGNTMLELDPKAVVQFGGGLTETGFTFTGSAGTPVSVTENILLGANFVTVEDSSGFSVNEYVRILTTETFDPHRTATKKAELCKIREIPDGTTLRLWGPTLDQYLSADGTITATPVTMARGCGLVGGAMIGTTEAASNELIGAAFRYCEQPILDMTMGRFDSRAAWFLDCVGGGVRRMKGFDSVSNGSGYLVSIANASRDMVIENILAKNFRHVTSTNNESALGGVVRNILWRNIVAEYTSTALAGSETPGDMFDTHAASDGMTYEHVRAYGSKAHGFNFEGINNSMRDCEVYSIDGPGNRAVSAINWTKYPSKLVIDRFFANQLDGRGISVSGGQTKSGVAGYSAEHELVDIRDIEMTGDSSNAELGILVSAGNPSARVPKLRTIRCDLNGFGGNQVIQAQRVDVWETSGNTGSGNAGEYYRASDVLKFRGDLGSPDVAASQSVLLIGATTEKVRISGGAPTGGASSKGINAVAGVGDIVVSDTDLSGVATPFDIPDSVPFRTDDPDAGELIATIATGVIASGVRAHTKVLSVLGEGAAADDLWQVDVSQMHDGDLLLIRANSNSQAITVKDAGGAGGEGTPNFRLNGSADRVLNDNTDFLLVAVVGSQLYEVSYSDN